MTALKELKQMALNQKLEQYPNVPAHAVASPRYTDKTSNGLTKCIIDFLLLQGWQAERVSVTGRYVDNTKVVSDVLGRKKRIGSSKWIKSSMQKGTADISSTIKGKSVKIEVKIGKDKQRQEQKQYQEQIERAGGIYFIASSFDQFITMYNSNFK